MSTFRRPDSPICTRNAMSVVLLLPMMGPGIRVIVCVEGGAGGQGET